MQIIFGELDHTRLLLGRTAPCRVPVVGPDQSQTHGTISKIVTLAKPYQDTAASSQAEACVNIIPGVPPVGYKLRVESPIEAGIPLRFGSVPKVLSVFVAFGSFP